MRHRTVQSKWFLPNFFVKRVYLSADVTNASLVIPWRVRKISLIQGYICLDIFPHVYIHIDCIYCMVYIYVFVELVFVNIGPSSKTSQQLAYPVLSRTPPTRSCMMKTVCMCMIGDQEYFTPQTTEMLPAFKAVNRKLQNTNIKMFFLSVLGSIYR